jgi:hypothetical protein
MRVLILLFLMITFRYLLFGYLIFGIAVVIMTNFFFHFVISIQTPLPIANYTILANRFFRFSN